jgi:hypothetical protein
MERASTTYNQLIDRVQYYFALASEKPAKQVEKAKLLQELTHQKNQNAILRADLKAALAESLTLRYQDLSLQRLFWKCLMQAQILRPF